MLLKIKLINQLTQGGYDMGTLTLAGQINYPAGTVTVERVGSVGITTAELFGIQFEADDLTVNSGSNQYEAVYNGPDLSGVVGGAGGIGGILSETDVVSDEIHSLHTDIMGNVVLVSDESGSETATYQSSPFGQFLNRTGTYTSRFLFSSKEYEPETGFYYFGHRHYSPLLARWISRDPVLEVEHFDPEFLPEGANVYEFVDNSSVNGYDILGLYTLNDAITSICERKCLGMTSGGARRRCRRQCRKDLTGEEVFNELLSNLVFSDLNQAAT